MKKLLIIAAMAATAVACTPKTAPELPMETFFRNSEKSDYQISPDGKYFSYMAPWESRRNIFVQQVGSDEAVRITSERERDLAGYFWANDSRILYLKDTGGDENFQLYGVDIDGTDPKAYTAVPGVRTTIIDPLEEIDSLMIIGTNERNPQIFDPYRLNLNTGEKTLLCENPGDVQGWQTDHDGKLRVAYAVVDGVNTQIRYRESEAEEFRPVLTTNFKEGVSFATFTPDNRMVYAITNLGRDKDALVLMDPATCEEKEVLYTNDTYDLAGVWYSEKEKKLLGVSYEGHKGTTRHFFDREAGELFGRMERHLRGYELGIVGSDKAEDKYIVYAGSDRTAGAYYIYDVAADTMTKLADLRPWIKQEEMAEMLPIEYTARDGERIEGYLTLPVGKTLRNAKNLPVVVNPHGGPWARDSWGFNPEAQFLANRGYAVLQMNFRGSTGFGRRFTEIAFGKWGQEMQDDLTDGVNWLIGKGIADPARIAIYGGSYGGYATLQGIVKDPDLYACAIDYVGVSNLFSFLNTIPPYWKPLLDQMYEMVGNPETQQEMLRENSPALNAGRIKTPLLVVQGANDPRVNINESNQMVEALRARGVEVDYMVKDNEGHGFHNEENRFDFYRAMEKFFGKHLKGVRPEGDIVPESCRR